jgi:DNA-binding NarL/FixJ family response regulator
MKVLLADDHALIRSGLRGELRELDANVEFLEAWDSGSLHHAFERHPELDLALVDLDMPGMHGAQTIAALRREFPAVPVVVLSAAEAPAQVQAALLAGASGFIPKSALARVMLQAIRLVLAGGQYLPPQLVRAPAETPASPAAPYEAEAGPGETRRLDLLSPRQREVFALLAEGLSNKMIARRLGITEGTVKTHVATIFDLLKVHNRVSAVAAARRLADAGTTGGAL